MRRLHGGWLAAPLLLLATGCGVTDTDAASPVPATEIAPAPALAAERNGAEPDSDFVDDLGTDLRVLVVGVEGAAAPGLDAAVTTLLARPSTSVVAVVVDMAAGSTTTTMSGFPVRTLRAGIGDILAGTDGLDDRPHLVVIGITAADAVGTGLHTNGASSVARQAADAGIPSVVVAAGGTPPDFAAASRELTALLDLELDRVLDAEALVLAVPSCSSGMVRGRTEAVIGAGAPPTEVDCAEPANDASGAPSTDDVTAYTAGFATLSTLPG